MFLELSDYRSLSRRVGTAFRAPPRVHRSRQLVPDLHLVAIGIDEENVGLARHELTVVADRASRGPDGGQGASDVARPSQPEPEGHDAAAPSGLSGLALEHEHVAAAWRLGLHELPPFVDEDHA